jgi:hypothetical protein
MSVNHPKTKKPIPFENRLKFNPKIFQYLNSPPEFAPIYQKHHTKAII